MTLYVTNIQSSVTISKPDMQEYVGWFHSGLGSMMTKTGVHPYVTFFEHLKPILQASANIHYFCK